MDRASERTEGGCLRPVEQVIDSNQVGNERLRKNILSRGQRLANNVAGILWRAVPVRALCSIFSEASDIRSFY